jgi:hypothetical protein
MGREFAPLREQALERGIDVPRLPRLLARLDREDIL